MGKIQFHFSSNFDIEISLKMGGYSAAESDPDRYQVLLNYFQKIHTFWPKIFSTFLHEVFNFQLNKAFFPLTIEAVDFFPTF